MSQHTHSSGDEHGSLLSYVAGFLLSLIFTFIPYFMVVNKVITGKPLLIAILGFALIQMIIQVTFFLHLGRGPKPNWNLFFFVSTVGIILIVVGGSVFIMDNLHYNMMPTDQVKKLVNDEGIYQINGKETGACQGQHKNHKVTLKNGQASPLVTMANKCDTLTFINEDAAEQLVTFGTYPYSEVYAGNSGINVRNGRNETITLSETGAYQFYDSIQRGAVGQFVVTE